MNEALEKELQNAAQEAASLKNLREKFLLLAEHGDRAALGHVAELEKREAAAQLRIKEIHIRRLPLAR